MHGLSRVYVAKISHPTNTGTHELGHRRPTPKLILAAAGPIRSLLENRNTQEAWNEAVRGGAMRNKTYLCFRADTVSTIDPDVLGHAITLLVEIDVLHELDWISAMEWQIKGA